MKNIKKIGLAILLATVTLSANEGKADLKKDMMAQEAAMSNIQKALLYSSKEGVKEGVAALKDANEVAKLKERLPGYLPEGKQAIYKTAMKQGESVNKNADLMLKALSENRYNDAFQAYGKVLNSCNTCHVVIRNWK